MEVTKRHHAETSQTERSNSLKHLTYNSAIRSNSNQCSYTEERSSAQDDDVSQSVAACCGLLRRSGGRGDSVRGGAGTEEDDLGDGWGLEEFGA